MNFGFTKEQQFVRQMVREFGEKEIAPIAADYDKTHEFPREILKKFADYGFFGLKIPKEYGGAGGDILSYAVMIEELTRADVAAGTVVAAHLGLCCMPILMFGTEEQKQEWLVPLAKGEKIGAFGLTEPNAGSDAGGQQTYAVKDGDEWVLNGAKVFITNSEFADTFYVVAMTDKSKGLRGCSNFLVSKDDPGFSIGKVEDKLGINASSTAELVFQNCRIPADRLLGKEGKGFMQAMMVLDDARVGVAAQGLGCAQGAWDLTNEYIHARKQFGKTLAKQAVIRDNMADMATRIQAARLLVYDAAKRAQAHDPSLGLHSAMAKYYASEVGMYVATKGVQYHGGYGYTKDYAIEKFFRDAKIIEIYEGTSEIQKVVIAGHLL